jgi:hypothetical protein
MDTESIAKDFIVIQKQSFNNAIDTMTLFQDQADRTNRLLADQMGLGEKEQKFVEQWRRIFKKGRDDYRKLINENFANMEIYFTGVERTKST